MQGSIVPGVLSLEALFALGETKCFVVDFRGWVWTFSRIRLNAETNVDVIVPTNGKNIWE
jgi:hypothetical protein